MNKAIAKFSTSNSGFTIMEIVVAATIFAVVVAAMSSLFNYTLKTNRRAEAIRQGSQGMRDFVELLTKEVRNGDIDYGMSDPETVDSAPVTPAAPCGLPSGSTWGQNLGTTPVGNTYPNLSNWLGIIDTNGMRECIYLGDINGNYVGNGTYNGATLALAKSDLTNPQVITPSNTAIDYAAFFVNPQCNPSSICADYPNSSNQPDLPRMQPEVSVFIRFDITLPTGEHVIIPYQTSVSTQDYSIPH